MLGEVLLGALPVASLGDQLPPINYTLEADNGSYLIAGFQTRFIFSIFEYGDSEIVRVPWQNNTLAVPADPDFSGGTAILHVPSEGSSVNVSTEYRVAAVPARMRA